MEEPDFSPEFVTAAVIPQPPLTGPQLPAVVPAVEGWTIHKVADLVRDLAMNLYDEPAILHKHRLTPADYDAIKKNKYFQNALEQETLAWNSPQSATRRLALEAAMAVENALPTVAARMHNKNEPLSDVVALLKLLSELAGAIGSKAANLGGPSASQFKITINLGADREVYDKSKPTITLENEGTDALASGGSVPEGGGTLLSVSADPQKA